MHESKVEGLASALSPKFASSRGTSFANFVCLLDHLVGNRQQRRRDGNAERLGSVEVDHELELGRLLDGEVGGLAPLRILSTYSAARR